MTPNQAMLVALLGSIFTSTAWPVFGPKIIEWKNRKKTAQEQAELAADERRERERDKWMKNADEAYERMETKCEKCETRLNTLSSAFYDLLDDLADADGCDVQMLRAQVRAAARKARAAADWERR